jgi:hypothetical protein
MRSPSFLTGALVIGVTGAIALGLIAAAGVPKQIITVDDNWRDRYGWKGDLGDGAVQHTGGYTFSDDNGAAWLSGAGALPVRLEQDYAVVSYEDNVLLSDQHDEFDMPVDETAETMTASYNADPLLLEEASATAARSADEVANEVREAEISFEASQQAEPAPKSTAGDRAATQWADVQR